MSKADEYEHHVASAARALTAANNHPTNAVERYYFSQIAMANLAYARELREAGL